MKDLDYRIGVDIGTNSIGWSIIKLQFNDTTQRYEKSGIIDLGVRMFDKAEIPKTGASLAEPRRLARSSRRRLKRKSERKQIIRRLLVDFDILSQEELDHLFPLPKDSVDIWDIRLEGLERVLNRFEWARLLLHLAQRRGFKSSRKSQRNETETGKMLASIYDNKNRLSAYRTVGEMWMKDKKFAQYDKRRNSPDEYIFNVSRDDLEKEIMTLFEVQRTFLSAYASEQLQEAYLKVWNHQLPFASGNDILKKVGHCSLEKNERRIPKATYTFQYFAALDKINNLRLGDDVQPLTQEQQKLLLKKMFERIDFVKKKNIPIIKYSDLRKWLKLDESICFKGLTYNPNEKLSKVEKKEFINLKPYYEMKKVISKHYEKHENIYEVADFDTFGYALTIYKNDQDIRSYLRNSNNIGKKVYDEELIEDLLNLSYTKFGHLSFKALQNLIPIMEEGKSFVDATKELSYDTTGLKKTKKSRLLPPIPDDITNSIVKRSLTQSRKVVNSIIKTYGPPLSIHIELARELSKDHEERRKISKTQDENYRRNKGAIEVLLENGIINPKGYDIVRYKLWKEQRECCAYSLKKIPSDVFFSEIRRERGSSPILEVDHILPYSQSFMDSYHNKVLVYSDENRKKRDLIPYDYIKGEEQRWKDFESYVQTNNLFSKKKRENLLKKEYTSRESDMVKERHLNDTRYATRFFKNFMEQRLLFKEAKVSMKKRVQTVNGIITSHFRSRWGLEKVREDTYLHHALDAVVVACTDQHMVTRVTGYYKNKESSLKSKEPFFPWPWKGFRDELLTRLTSQPVPDKISEALQLGQPLPDYRIISRMPKRSITGAAHKETIMMKGGIDEKTGKTIIVKRVALKDIKFDKNGDFEMVGKEQDMATYTAIKERYLQHKKNAEKAFEKPIYKPSKKGRGNPIKRVKVVFESKAFVREVNGGVANNEKLVRVDLFEKDGKYSMAPIYVMDTVTEKLPDKIVTIGKGHHQWRRLDESYTFLFSLHPYDLVRVRSEEADTFFYFGSIDINSNRIHFKHVNHPTKPNELRYALGKIDLLEKYEIGLLGDIKQVKKETRNTFHQPKKQLTME
ncbi:type II CRISPR RNA-guided endonuclease Cas9 [Priestia filamentosa]|uniref:type II CRISPR RNA-guided endonuclease Cas9 n=1 Tax=Priestia filamentosa TaxID=1402861 RepID=UPI0028950145|nr:type II CRISPR RNA-guided endonuclease Cas9 [Priestia filamentosa]MDT3766201.1 type II CRISPR RNA-guided endonuclease Cas9 [Priestia filamentosa]